MYYLPTTEWSVDKIDISEDPRTDTWSLKIRMYRQFVGPDNRTYNHKSGGLITFTEEALNLVKHNLDKLVQALKTHILISGYDLAEGGSYPVLLVIRSNSGQELDDYIQRWSL